MAALLALCASFNGSLDNKCVFEEFDGKKRRKSCVEIGLHKQMTLAPSRTSKISLRDVLRQQREYRWRHLRRSHVGFSLPFDGGFSQPFDGFFSHGVCRVEGDACHLGFVVVVVVVVAVY